jgi:hypothetical protein
MRLCCVLACDAAFFYQAAASIETIRRFPLDPERFELDIAFIDIGLRAEQIAWLTERGIRLHTNLGELPRFNDAPEYTYALTCRPYLPRLLPDYDAYIWIDCDIRFLLPAGLQYYAQQLLDSAVSIIAAQETEPSYRMNADARTAQAYHSQRVRRIAKVYGTEVVQYCQYYTPFNSGLFAARADSPIWTRYRRNLQKALHVPFNGMLQQDALNVSMLEVGGWVRAPSVMNWLCSQCLPIKAEDATWRDPHEPGRRVFVAHLTDSTAAVTSPQGRSTFYETYRSLGLTG